MDTLIKTASRTASVGGDHLRTLGHKAAMLAESSGLPLTEAVCRTISGQNLNPIQVQRVVEFTNHEAFENKYSALLGGTCTAVEFSAGPADPEVVLMQLEKSGGMTRDVPVHASTDYSMAPTKRAHVELMYDNMRTPEGLRGDQLRQLSMLKAAHEELTGSAEASRYMKDQHLENVCAQTKQALAAGASPARVLEAWTGVDAMLAAPTADRVFGEISLPKIASHSAPINPRHPVVTSFAAFSKEAHNYVTLRKGLLELESQMHGASARLRAGGS